MASAYLIRFAATRLPAALTLLLCMHAACAQPVAQPESPDAGHAIQSSAAAPIGARDIATSRRDIDDPLLVTARKTYFISPAGRDENDGRSPSEPLKSFNTAFARMAAGDELVLLDGVYSVAAGTGVITYYDETGRGEGSSTSTLSGQIPSGVSRQRPTVVRALNPGKVTVHGMLFIGRRFRKDSFITVQGATFEGGGALYNSGHVTVKDCGFHGSFGIGTNDHHEFNNDNLIEDVWIWAAGERVIAINYRAHRNVWRRVVVRGDGCGRLNCAGPGNPNVGISVYESSDVSLQNVIVVDRILAATDKRYSDFAVAQHTPDPRYYFGRNEWLGTISYRAPDQGYYMEPDQGATVDPTIKISNAVAWGARYSGINLDREGTSNLIENITIGDIRQGDGVIAGWELKSGILRNLVVKDVDGFGVSSVYTPSHANVYNAGKGAYYRSKSVCAIGCYRSDPTADGTTPSLRFFTRIEAGSLLKGKGHNGADIGANILYRYGADGSRFGDPGYNTLTNVPLWPWLNEARIKREMCRNTTRGFCSAGKRLDGVNPVTLTSYLWEALGNPVPQEVYSRERQ